MLACRNPIDRIPKVFRNTSKLCAYLLAKIAPYLNPYLGLKSVFLYSSLKKEHHPFDDAPALLYIKFQYFSLFYGLYLRSAFNIFLYNYIILILNL